MSSTNKTTNYELSQFLGSDKPAWLVDYNGDMLKIDTQMKANADGAAAAQTKANTADGKADINAGAIQNLNTEINGPTGLANDVSTLAGSVNTITSLIGNGEPTTTNKTLIGAINELNANEGNLTTLTTTEKSSIVGAINEINSELPVTSSISGKYVVTPRQSIEVVADGTKTNGALLTELNTAFGALLTADTDAVFRPDAIVIDSVGQYKCMTVEATVSSGPEGIYTLTAASSTNLYIGCIRLQASPVWDTAEFDTTSFVVINDQIATVPTSGKRFRLFYDKLTPIEINS